MDYGNVRATLIAMAVIFAIYCACMSYLGLIMTADWILTILPIGIIPAVAVGWRYPRSMCCVVFGILISATCAGASSIHTWQSLLVSAGEYQAGYVAGFLLLAIALGDSWMKWNGPEAIQPE